MREALNQVITELWKRCHAHNEDAYDAESLFQKRHDEGAAEAYEWAAKRLEAVVKEHAAYDSNAVSQPCEKEA